MSKQTIAQVNVVLKAQTAGFNKGLLAAKKRTTAFQSSMKALKGTMLTMFGAGAAFSIMRGAVRTIADFDQSMANLKAIVQPTENELEKLRESAKLLGRETKFTNVEVATLQTELGKLGFTAKEVINAQEAILDLAAATNTELAQAAIVAGTTLRQFGLDATETSRVVDVMAKSFTSSALDMDKFSESMKYVGPIANAANISLEETTAMMAALANAGIDGSMAGTSLKMIINKLTTDAKPLSEKLRELSDNGLSFSEANKEVGLRAQAALLVLEDQIDTLGTLETSFIDAGGAAKEMADIQLDTLIGKATELKSAWSGFVTELAENETVLEGTKKRIDEITQSVNNLTDTMIIKGRLDEIAEALDISKFAARMLPTEVQKEVLGRIDRMAFDWKEKFDALFGDTEGLVEEAAADLAKPMKKYWEVLSDVDDILGLLDFELSEISEGLKTMGDETLAAQLKLEDFKDSLLETIDEMPEEFFDDMGDIPIYDATIDKAEIFKEDMKDLSIEMNKILDGMIVGTVSALAEMAGAWAAGADMDGQFNNILAKFGDFAKEMGGLIMSYGIALKAMKQWDKPGLMIAGGIALMVLGGAISHLASKGVEGSSTGTGTSQSVDVSGEFRVQGSDLVYAMNRANSDLERG